MPILPMALSLVMGYAIHTQFSRIWFSILQTAKCPSASVYGCVLVKTSAERQTLGGPRTRGKIHGWMTPTKILVPTCLYCLNCTKFGQLILRKIFKIVATMSDFKAKMHQIRSNSYSLLFNTQWQMQNGLVLIGLIILELCYFCCEC